MVAAHDALRKNQIVDKQQQHAGLHQNSSGDAQAHIARPRRPADAQAERGGARRAEAEEEPRGDEVVVALAVEQEDGDVGDGGGDVQDQEHGADGVVDARCGLAAEDGGCWGVGRILGGLVNVETGRFTR